jgi:hypothetical protein
VEKVEALERASQAVRDAKRTAAEAPRRDEAARVAAHQADKKPPAPTVAKANEAVELAERTRDLCRTLRQFAQGGVYAGGSSA